MGHKFHDPVHGWLEENPNFNKLKVGDKVYIWGQGWATVTRIVGQSERQKENMLYAKINGNYNSNLFYWFQVKYKAKRGRKK